MAINDYFPHQDAKLLAWTNNFEAGIQAYGPALGMSPTEQLAVLDASKNIRQSILDNNQGQAAAKKATAIKVAAIRADEAIIRPIVKRAKTAGGYTEAIGKATGILGEDSGTDWHTYKPSISADAYPGHITIRFTKLGVQGVNIYERLKGADAWVKLAFDGNSPYIDNRPSASEGQSENREYMAIGVLNDSEIGQQSDIVSITFAG